jgi:hypothetical protein
MVEQGTRPSQPKESRETPGSKSTMPTSRSKQGAGDTSPALQENVAPAQGRQAPRRLAPPPGNRDGTPDKPSGSINREVTVFFSVAHEIGQVVTGWQYEDGTAGAAPVSKYCYFTVHDPNGNELESRRIDIGRDGAPLPNIKLESVPNLDEALGKCHWIEDMP